MFIDAFWSLSGTINAIYSVHCAHEIDTFMSYNLCYSSFIAERSLSVLRTLKTFTRSTMNASRLTLLALLHFHQDGTDKMDLNDLCQTFVGSRPQRESLWQIDGII